MLLFIMGREQHNFPMCSVTSCFTPSTLIASADAKCARSYWNDRESFQTKKILLKLIHLLKISFQSGSVSLQPLNISLHNQTQQRSKSTPLVLLECEGGQCALFSVWKHPLSLIGVQPGSMPLRGSVACLICCKVWICILNVWTGVHSS